MDSSFSLTPSTAGGTAPSTSFASSFSSFKNISIYQSVNSSAADASPPAAASSTANPANQFTNIHFDKFVPDPGSSFEQFSQRPYSSFCQANQSSNSFSTTNIKNPFGVNSSSANNNPFLLQSSCTRGRSVEPSDNPFLSSNVRKRENSPFKSIMNNNLFLRSCSANSSSSELSCNRAASNIFTQSATGRSTIPSASGPPSLPLSASSTSSSSFPVPAAHHPHLFRPVSPAAVSGPCASGVQTTEAVDAMITDDQEHFRAVPADASDPSSPAVADAMLLLQQNQHQLRDCPMRSADAAPTQATDVPISIHHRTSLDSNKSFQDMDLTEDVSQTPVDI